MKTLPRRAVRAAKVLPPQVAGEAVAEEETATTPNPNPSLMMPIQALVRFTTQPVAAP